MESESEYSGSSGEAGEQGDLGDLRNLHARRRPRQEQPHFATSFWVQFLVLLRRMLLQTSRNKVGQQRGA